MNHDLITHTIIFYSEPNKKLLKIIASSILVSSKTN